MAESASEKRRKSVRLRGFDYTSGGGYFVTICTADRRCIFARPRTPDLALTRLGLAAVEKWMEIPEHFPFVTIDAFVVMPDHIHGVLLLDMQRGGGPRERFRSPVPGSIATIVRSFKSAVTKYARERSGDPGFKVWQRGYYDRIIRDEAELRAIQAYIRENPDRWVRKMREAEGR